MEGNENNLSQRIKELTALNDMARDINVSLSVEQVISSAYRHILAAVAPDLAVIYLMEEDRLISQGERPENLTFRKEAPSIKRVGECLCGLVAIGKKPVYSQDIHADERCTLNECKRAGLKSFAALPLIVDNDVLGVLGIGSYRKRDFSQQTSFLEILSLQIAIAIKNAMLHEKLEDYSRKLSQALLDLMHSEEEKKRARKDWSDIFQAIRNPMLILDVNHNILMANSATEKLTGMGQDELYGKKCHEIVHGIEVPAECCPLERMLKSGQMETFEMQMETIGGIFLVSCTPVLDEKGQIEKVIHISTDITERKQVEQALRESERKYRELVENANSIIMRWNHLGEITFMNEFGLKFFGFTEAEILGRHVVGTIVPETESSGRDLRKLMDEICLHPLNFERNINENMRRNGDRVLIEWTNKMVLDDQGELIETLSIGSDITERKQAEKSLRESETRYRRLHDSIMDAYVVVGMDGSVKEYNNAYRDMLDYDDDELSRLTYKDITPEKWHGFEEEIVEKQILLMGYSDIYEKEYRKKDGTIFPIEVRTYLLKDDVGKPIGMWAIIRDITKRKQVEEALKESNARFRAFMDYSPSLVLIKDHDLRPVYFNRPFSELFPAHEWLGKTPAATFPPDIAKSMEEYDRKALADGYVQYEELWTDSAGNKHVFETRKFRIDSSDAPPLLGAIINDITERKRAENELRESEKRYRQLIEQAADGIFVVDEKGNYLLVNSKFCEMLGYTEGELLTLNVLDTYPDELKDIGRQRIDRVVSGERLRFERTMKRKDASIFYVELSVSKLDELRQQGIIHDITDRKKAEDEKRRLEFQLIQAQKMEAIGTLAGGIAHDFNNILLAIIGYTQLALGDISDPEKAKRELNEVLKAGDRAKNLVKQILTFSRKAETAFSTIDLSITVADSLKMIRATIPTYIEIRQDLIDSGFVMSNTTQIQQIVMNLCINAAHAMDEHGGILDVSLKRIDIQENTLVRVLDLFPGPYMKLTISDTGCGMTPDIIGRIFEPYFTTKEVGRGTGLGLSVVHGIVKTHGGAINCQSNPGKGTSFDVYLPEIEKPAQKMESAWTEQPLPTGIENILFIDDEPVLVNLGKEILDKLGYRVITRTSSIEALELFQRNPDKYDLVVTDMTMPELTGDKLAQKLIEIRDDIPIILCTGHSEHISKEKAKIFGIREFIMKPFEIKEFANTVRKVLNESKMLAK